MIIITKWTDWLIWQCNNWDIVPSAIIWSEKSVGERIVWLATESERKGGVHWCQLEGLTEEPSGLVAQLWKMASVLLMVLLLLSQESSLPVVAQLVDDSYSASSNNRCVDDQGNAQVNFIPNPSHSIQSIVLMSDNWSPICWTLYLLSDEFVGIIPCSDLILNLSYFVTDSVSGSQNFTKNNYGIELPAQTCRKFPTLSVDFEWNLIF